METSTQSAIDGNGTTEEPEGTTQVVQFTLNGQEERFIVAQEVKVEVYFQEPPFDDYALFSDAEHEGESSGSRNNDSVSLNHVSSKGTAE